MSASRPTRREPSSPEPLLMRCCPSPPRCREPSACSSRCPPTSVGWPVVEGGSARITDAMIAELESLGGRDPDEPLGSQSDRPPGLPGWSCSTSLHASCSLLLAGPAGEAAPCSRALRVRARSLQGRLGAERGRSVERRRMPQGRDGPSRRDVRGDRRERVRGRRRPPPRAALLHHRPAVGWWTRAGPPKEARRCGATAMSRPDPTST